MGFNIQYVKLELYRATSSAKLDVLYFGKEIGSLDIDYCDGKRIHIYNFGINQPFRHLGIGRKMLRYIKELYKDRYITLGVEKANNIAFNLYKSEDFKIKEDCGYYYMMEFNQLKK